MWRAVAAADLRAAWFLAFASLVAQSGLTLSVVITVEAFAEIEVVLRRAPAKGLRVGLAAEFRDEDDDIAEPAVTWFDGPRFAYPSPLLNGGGS